MSLRVSTIIFQLFKVITPEKCALTILSFPSAWDKTKLNICHAYAHVVHTTAKKGIHAIERTRTSSKCQKMKNARAKTLFPLSNMQICGGFVAVVVVVAKLPSLAPCEELNVFAYQIWKSQFLSVVQFPCDNCHSPFSPTKFFEIGACILLFFSQSVLGRIYLIASANKHYRSK